MTFPADAVADDFGPRRHTSNYHLGIDYNCAQDDGNNDKWNMILAPEGGTTVDVNRLCTKSKVFINNCVTNLGIIGIFLVMFMIIQSTDYK